MLGDSTDGIESTFASNGIFLVAKLLLQKLDYSVAFVSCLGSSKNCDCARAKIPRTKGGKNSLRGSVGLLNVTIDEGGEIERRSVDLILGL